MDLAHIALIGAAALSAGVVNAIAGGGSLITFPVLIAVGLPAVTASMTNTVAMCPGYLGATLAQRGELAGQRGRALRLVPLSLAGSIAGAWILLHTSERAFQTIVPFLLLFAAALLAFQRRLRDLLAARAASRHSLVLAIAPVGLAAIYGAYFGAGLGIILLAILAVTMEDSVIRANALKQLLTLAINTCAALFFLGYGKVDWSVAGVVAAGSLVGGVIGGKLASRVPEAALRWFAILVAVGVAARDIVAACVR